MSQDELDDEQLMARVAGGDEKALATLYDRYAPSVMGLAIQVLRDRAAAEEVVQETFWRVWRHARTFEAQRGTFTSWMFSIARRRAIDVTRRQKVRPQAARSEAEEARFNSSPDPAEGVAEAAWVSMQRQRVREAINQLPHEQYEVIRLAYFQGMTRQEIADKTNNPLGTIHTRARLALIKLRSYLQEEAIDA